MGRVIELIYGYLFWISLINKHATNSLNMHTTSICKLFVKIQAYLW